MFKNWNSDQAPSMDPIEEALLDEALNGAGQQFVAQGIKKLESETPSLAWRSALNERILAEAAKRGKNRRRQIFVWRPAIGFGMATALAVMLIMPRQPAPVVVDPVKESEVFSAHSAAEHSFYLTGTTAVSRETEASGFVQTAGYDWNSNDLSAL